MVVDDIDAVIDALEHFRQGGDLADQLILATARDQQARLQTIDNDFRDIDYL